MVMIGLSVSEKRSSPLTHIAESFFLPEISFPSSTQPPSPDTPSSDECKMAETKSLNDFGTTPRRQRWKTGLTLNPWAINTCTLSVSTDASPSLSSASSDSNSDERKREAVS